MWIRLVIFKNIWTYSRIYISGKKHEVRYEADENGFRVLE